MTDRSLLDHFEHLHASSPDPWEVSTRWYERRKRELTVAALPRERYRSALELGCSIGALTTLLAPRCETLLAVDGSPAAVDTCRQRVGEAPGVSVMSRVLPDDWPPGRFDLVVLSEIGYYFDSADLDRSLAAAAESLEPEGHLIAIHWRQVADDFRTSGAEVHARMLALDDLEPLAGYRDEDFLLDVCRRR